MSQSTAKKPAKPRPDFPLWPHPCGYWCKKIRKKNHYFTKWADDPDGVEAERIWQREGDDLLAGRVPKPEGGTTIGNLLFEFASEKKKAKEAGELSPRSYLDVIRVCDLLRDHFGEARPLDDIRAADFTALHEKFRKRGWNPTTMRCQIGRVKAVFSWAYEAELMDHKVRFGPVFKTPSAKAIREAKNANGRRTFTAEEIRTILEVAPPNLKAMTLLAINCCFGNSDVGNLPKSALDIEDENNAWVEFPRPKTAVMRRIPLWPETVRAVREALARRPKHRSPRDADVVFVTIHGVRFAKNNNDQTLSQEFRKLLNKVGITRRGAGFYHLRHTAATIADESRDPNAVKSLLGHLETGVTSDYKHGISDERMRAVTDCIHRWLFGQK